MENDVKELAKAEYEVARLRVIDQVSRLIGSLLLSICLILVVFAVLAFCAAAAVVALAQCVPTWAACLIVGAVYFLLIPVLIACYKVLFINPLIRKMSGMKNAEELKMETLRAEGHAAVQLERITGRIRLAKAVYEQSVQLGHMVWNLVRGLFKK